MILLANNFDHLQVSSSSRGFLQFQRSEGFYFLSSHHGCCLGPFGNYVGITCPPPCGRKHLSFSWRPWAMESSVGRPSELMHITCCWWWGWWWRPYFRSIKKCCVQEYVFYILLSKVLWYSCWCASGLYQRLESLDLESSTQNESQCFIFRWPSEACEIDWWAWDLG